MVFGGHNKLVRGVILPVAAYLEFILQELMKNGDPRGLIESGKTAMVILDRCVLHRALCKWGMLTHGLTATSVGQSPWLMDLLWHLPAGKGLRHFRALASKMMRSRILATSPPPFKDLVTYLVSASSYSASSPSPLYFNRQTKAPSLLLIWSVRPRSLYKEVCIVLYIDICLSGTKHYLTSYATGSDNTSIIISLVLFFLVCERSCYQRLRDELAGAFPDPLNPLDHTKLAGLPYLDGVINETLRLGTPFFLPRLVPAGGVVIDGNCIPGGTVVALAAYSQQISLENFYPDPLVRP